MNKEQKTAAIETITTDIKEADAIFVVDYRGLTVAQAADLRTKLREADTTLRVVKNTLTIRAADAAGVEELKPVLVGPTAIAFVRGDAAMAAKALSIAQKETEVLAFKGGTMGGKALSVDEITALSKLPSRDVLIGQLVGLIAAPLGGLVRSLGGLIGGLASQLGQIRDGELVPRGGAAAPAAPAGEAEPAAEEPAAEEPVAEEAPEAEAAAEETATEAAPAEEPAAEAEAEETAEQAEGDEPAAETAPDETASADDAGEAGDGSADDNNEEDSDA